MVIAIASDRYTGFLFGACACLFLFARPVHAHKMDAARVDLATDGDTTSATLYLPEGWDNTPQLIAPSGCVTTLNRMVCESSLSEIRLEGLINDQQVFVFSNGESLLGTLTETQPGLSIHHKSSFLSTIWLGVTHVLGGWDHVAFLLALLLWVSSFKSRVIAITAFTLGHSLTLAAVAFGFSPWSSEVTELLIAFSVLMLAVETVGSHRACPGQFELAALVGAIGLIHGLGFGGVLLEFGTSRDDAIGVLFGFNVGIECGQLLLFSVWGVIAILGRYSATVWSVRTRAMTNLIVGVLGAFWTIDRSIVWVSSLSF